VVGTHNLNWSCIVLLLLGIRVCTDSVNAFVETLLATILCDWRNPGSTDRASVLLLQPLHSAAILAEVVLTRELHDKLIVLELFAADHTLYTVLHLDLCVLLDRQRFEGSVRSRV
jgi:hypothetical protein